jgi:hypothetical protein
VDIDIQFLDKAGVMFPKKAPGLHTTVAIAFLTEEMTTSAYDVFSELRGGNAQWKGFRVNRTDVWKSVTSCFNKTLDATVPVLRPSKAELRQTHGQPFERMGRSLAGVCNVV